jgi:hypothetical protein
VLVDGEPTRAAGEGAAYVLPGSHRVEARDGDDKAEERIVCAAGTTHHVALHPTSAQAPKPPPAPGPPSAPPPSAAPPPSHGLHPAVFFTALGVTAVLASVTIWSGVDAIDAKGGLPAAPMQAQEDDVRGRARRTDWLLLGAGLAGVGTIVLGAVGTDWKKPPRDAPAARLVVVPGGAIVGGRF